MTLFKKLFPILGRPLFYLILLSILFFGHFEQEQYTYQLHWLSYALFSIVVISDMLIAPTFGWLPAVCFCYTMAGALWVGLARMADPMMLVHLQLTHNVPDDTLRMAARYYVLDTAVRTLLIVLPVLIICSRDKFRVWIKDCELGVLFFTLSSVAYAIYQKLFDHDLCSKEKIECGGILMNPSMGACMVAVTTPLFFRYGRKFGYAGYLLAVLSAYLAGSSVAWGLVAAQPLIALIWFKQWRYIPIPLGVIGVAYKILGSELMNDSNRIRTWKFFMQYWARENHWLGTGAGTFAVFSSDIQIHNSNFDTAWWVWMHNDWLQIMFEQGYIGIALYLSLFCLAIRNLIKRKETQVAMSLFLYGLCATVNYPLHLAFSAAIGAWLMAFALVKSKDNGGYYGKGL